MEVKNNYNNIEYNISDDNCHIVKSYETRSKQDMENFCSYVLLPSFFTARSLSSYVAEWRAHNVLYDLHLFRSHTKDVDLNINEPKWKRFFYRILSVFYWRGKK